MSGTTTSSYDNSGLAGSLRDSIIQYNKLVDDVETLRAKFALVLAKLDLDAGVTDTTYASLHAVAAATLTAAKVGTQSGVAITT